MKVSLSILASVILYTSSFSQFPMEHQFTATGLSSTWVEGELVYIEYFDLPDSAGFVLWDSDYNWMTTLDHSGIGQHNDQYIFYISRYLFDEDPGIEFILRDSGGGASDIYVVNEDETIIEVFENRSIDGTQCEPWADIQNADDRTVMRLSHLNTFNTYVFTLPGHLHCCTCDQVIDELAMGCTYPDALNYDPLAEQDDQSCLHNTCPGDFNNNLMIDTLDLLEFLSVFGADCG